MTLDKPALPGESGEPAPDPLLARLVPHELTEEPESTRKFMSGSRRRFFKNIPGVVGLTVIVLIIIIALIGPFFTQNPNHANIVIALSDQGVLGTDSLGRDMLARIIEGGRVALFVSFLATALGVLVGMLLGVTAGYVGGWVDEILARVFDMILTFPMILLGILIVVAVGPSLITVSIAIAVAIVPRYGRQFRAQTLACVQRDFIQAVQAQGYSPLRIIGRHVLPNIWMPIAIVATGNMGKVAVSEASLSYLGAGVQAPNASWGNMILEGQQFLQTNPAQAIYPGLALCALALSFSYVGDALRDAFDLTE